MKLKELLKQINYFEVTEKDSDLIESIVRLPPSGSYNIDAVKFTMIKGKPTLIFDCQMVEPDVRPS